jgi:hypothetical protein
VLLGARRNPEYCRVLSLDLSRGDETAMSAVVWRNFYRLGIRLFTVSAVNNSIVSGSIGGSLWSK